MSGRALGGRNLQETIRRDVHAAFIAPSHPARLRGQQRVAAERQRAKLRTQRLETRIEGAALFQRKYGGDLDGEGGHFTTAFTLTADWSTFEVRFADLATPAWGDTSSLTEFAIGKLQSLDFGVGENADFEIFIDDVELF